MSFELWAHNAEAHSPQLAAHCSSQLLPNQLATSGQKSTPEQVRCTVVHLRV